MRNPSSFTYYLGLGTNLGDKEANLRTAVRLLEERVGKVTSLSAFHATEPWGFASDHTFLNAAAKDRTQEIERLMGRHHKSVNGVYADRVIDIDLLLCFAEDGTPVRINTEKLTLPHPLMRQREFVMKPLREIMGSV